MTRAYCWLMSHLSCCGCGCFIPLAGITVLSSVGGYVGWQVVT